MHFPSICLICFKKFNNEAKLYYCICMRKLWLDDVFLVNELGKQTDEKGNDDVLIILC